MDILPFVNKAFEQREVATGFEFWMIVLRAGGIVIGDIGFKGTPDEKGAVEIGCGIIDEEQGKGYGFEALERMLEWAFSQDGVQSVKADCLIDNAPSIKILEKAGMQEKKRGKDFIHWEITRQPNKVHHRQAL